MSSFIAINTGKKPKRTKHINVDNISHFEYTDDYMNRIFYLKTPADDDGSNIIVGNVCKYENDGLSEEELLTPATIIKADPGNYKITVSIDHKDKTYCVYKDTILAWKILHNKTKAPRPITPIAYSVHPDDVEDIDIHVEIYATLQPSGLVSCDVPEFIDGLSAHYTTTGEFVVDVLKKFKASEYKVSKFSTYNPAMPEPVSEVDTVEDTAQASFVPPTTAAGKPKTKSKTQANKEPPAPDLWG